MIKRCLIVVTNVVTNVVISVCTTVIFCLEGCDGRFVNYQQPPDDICPPYRASARSVDGKTGAEQLRSCYIDKARRQSMVYPERATPDESREGK